MDEYSDIYIIYNIITWHREKRTCDRDVCKTYEN